MTTSTSTSPNTEILNINGFNVFKRNYEYIDYDNVPQKIRFYELDFLRLMDVKKEEFLRIVQGKVKFNEAKFNTYSGMIILYGFLALKHRDSSENTKVFHDNYYSKKRVKMINSIDINAHGPLKSYTKHHDTKNLSAIKNDLKNISREMYNEYCDYVNKHFYDGNKYALDLIDALFEKRPVELHDTITSRHITDLLITINENIDKYAHEGDCMPKSSFDNIANILSPPPVLDYVKSPELTRLFKEFNAMTLKFAVQYKSTKNSLDDYYKSNTLESKKLVNIYKKILDLLNKKKRAKTTEENKKWIDKVIHNLEDANNISYAELTLEIRFYFRFIMRTSEVYQSIVLGLEDSIQGLLSVFSDYILNELDQIEKLTDAEKNVFNSLYKGLPCIGYRLPLFYPALYNIKLSYSNMVPLYIEVVGNKRQNIGDFDAAKYLRFNFWIFMRTYAFVCDAIKEANNEEYSNKKYANKVKNRNDIDDNASISDDLSFLGENDYSTSENESSALENEDDNPYLRTKKIDTWKLKISLPPEFQNEITQILEDILTKDEYDIAIANILNKTSATDIGEILGVSAQYISKILGRVKEKIRKDKRIIELFSE